MLCDSAFPDIDMPADVFTHNRLRLPGRNVDKSVHYGDYFSDEFPVLVGIGNSEKVPR